MHENRAFLIVFCTESHVFRAFSASYSCLSGRIGPDGARGILFGRGASSIAGAAVAWCAVGAAARIRVYGRQVGIPDTFKGWPPGLLSSTTGEQINDAAHDLQAGSCSPQRPKQTDDTTGSPRSLSDTFGRGIVRLLGDRRNLGRFRAIAGQWRATFFEGWPSELLASTGAGPGTAYRRCISRVFLYAKFGTFVYGLGWGHFK